MRGVLMDTTDTGAIPNENITTHHQYDRESEQKCEGYYRYSTTMDNSRLTMKR